MAAITRLPYQRLRHTAMSTATLPWPYSRVRACRPPGQRPAVRVPGLEREIIVEIAATQQHWDAAFRLVQQNYEAQGLAAPGSGAYRFTPYHALPNTAVLVARERDQVLATMSLFLDSDSLGLPSDAIFGAELDKLRRGRRRLSEGGNLADGGLSQREFLPVFVALNRLAWQYGIRQGANAVIITAKPRHGLFYRRVMGYVPLGPCRPYPYVEGHPAQAFWLDVPRLQAAAPHIHGQLLGTPLPAEALAPQPLPAELVRYFGSRSSLTQSRSSLKVMAAVQPVEVFRRWHPVELTCS